MRDKERDEARLQLMLENISNIENYLSGTTTLDAFSSNKLLTHAVFYNLQCIGEAVYKLSRDFLETHTSMDWQAIEGLRHVLVHDYYSVKCSKVWSILQEDIPTLKKYLLSIS